MKKHQQISFAPTDREELARRADTELVRSFDEEYFVRATAQGSLPGRDFLDAVFRVRGELGAPHLPFLPELPQRGYAASTLARTLVCLEGLSADGTASGWRVRTGRSEEHEQAISLFASDINALADVIGQEKSYTAEPYKLQLVGPVSLAASVYLSKGELLIADAGARRDLLQSFVEGFKPWARALGEASQQAPLTLQLQEPLLGQALDGSIKTSSGYQTHRHLPLHEVEAVFTYLQEELADTVKSLILETAPDLTPEVYRNFDGVAFSLQESDVATWENCARLLETGKDLWLGVQNPHFASSVSERAQWFVKNWRTVGLAPSSLAQVTVTDTGGLDELTPEVATTVLHHLTEVARAVAELASA